MMYRSIFFALLLAFSLIPGGAAEAAGKFAYVDVSRAITSCTANKRFARSFKRKVEAKKRELSKLAKEFEREKAALKKRKNLMTAEARSEMAAKLRSKYLKNQRFVEDSESALERESSGWNKKISRALRKVIQQIGRERGYTAVFAKGQVLYSSPSIDITDTVLKRLNTRTKKWF